jgi:putative transposase
MARKWSNLNLPGALHFITGNVLHRVPAFRSDACCETFLETCSQLLTAWPSKLIAYVLMPDHVHMIVNPFDGRIKEFTAVLKSLSAKSFLNAPDARLFKKNEKSERQFWQESFKALPLWSGWMIRQKINYVHANPVKACLVDSAKDYRWSSFRAFYMDSGEPLRVDKDWWWPDDAEKLSKATKELGWRDPGWIRPRG